MITLANGHRLGFAQYGDPDGKPLLFSHGTPGSRVLGRGLDAAARRHGIRVTAPERPGYGKSDYSRAETVADLCAAVIDLPDRLGLERFSVLGASGGGPYALGFSYLYPQRVETVTLVSSVGPAHGGGMLGLGAVVAALAVLSDRLVGLPLALVARHARRRPDAFVAQLDRHVGSFAGMANVGHLIYDDLQEVFASDLRGAGADIKRLRRWGFEPEQVSNPVRLWHGEDDRNVSVAAGRNSRRAASEGQSDLPCIRGALGRAPGSHRRDTARRVRRHLERSRRSFAGEGYRTTAGIRRVSQATFAKLDNISWPTRGPNVHWTFGSTMRG